MTLEKLQISNNYFANHAVYVQFYVQGGERGTTHLNSVYWKGNSTKQFYILCAGREQYNKL